MKEIFNPDLYHGKHKKKNFFEGWYYKIVDKTNSHKLAIIPGISYSNDKSQHHSFIQILNGHEGKYNYISYSSENFKYDNDKFRICIDSNIFTMNHVNLSINHDDISIKGHLVFKGSVKWPDSIINPGSMGFYNYLKFMECYSQVCILNGSLVGDLDVNGEKINFTGGKVYVEKNWGKSFPKSWLWIQSNCFNRRKASVTCSLGTIPFPIRDFQGFLIGVTVENQFYSFTTINRSKLHIDFLENNVILHVEKKGVKLTLKTYTDEKDFLLCKGPQKGKMSSFVRETLNGKVYVLLEDTKNNKKIFEDIGLSTGVEYGGEFLNTFKS